MARSYPIPRYGPQAAREKEMSFVLYYHRPTNIGTPLLRHVMSAMDQETIRNHHREFHGDHSECFHPEYHMSSTQEERVNANYAEEFGERLVGSS